MNCKKCGEDAGTSMLCRMCSIDKTYDIAYENGKTDERDRIAAEIRANELYIVNNTCLDCKNAILKIVNGLKEEKKC